MLSEKPISNKPNEVSPSTTFITPAIHGPSMQIIPKQFAIDKLRRDNVNDHRAAAKDLQAEKAARPAAPCATYCYHAYDLGQPR